MKKFLPLIIFVVGIIVFAGVYFLVIKPKNSPTKTAITTSEDANVPDIPLNQRPVISLTPTSDGHWLDMKIDKIVVPNTASLDYLLLYNLPDGRQQGVPGTVKVDSGKPVENNMLLGSESSGKFRYDEGVETGTLTIKFRDQTGKLTGKFVADFHLQTNTTDLSSPDSKFNVKLGKIPSKTFFVVMNTVGTPSDSPSNMTSGPYGFFASSDVTKLAGSISLEGSIPERWTGSDWSKEIGGDALSTGIFIGISQ